MQHHGPRAAKYIADESLLYNRENVNAVTLRMPVLNWIVSFFFFFFLIVRRVANCLKPGETSMNHVNGKLTFNDVCYFISSLTFEATNDQEMTLGVIVISTAVVLACIVGVVAYALPIRASGFTAETNVLLWSYVMPFCTVLGANLFVRTYLEMEEKAHALHYCAMVINGVMLVAVAWRLLGNSDAVTVVNHVFYHRDTISAAVCMTYYFVTIQSYGIFGSVLALDIFSLLSSAVMSLFVLFYFPFYHRLMNCWMLTVVYFMFFSSLARLIKSTIYGVANYTLILSVTLSVTLFYGIVPYLFPRWMKRNRFLVDFVCGKRNRAKLEIEQIDITLVPKRYWKALLVLSNELEVNRIDELIEASLSKHGDLIDSRFFWMYTNFVYSHQRMICETYWDLKFQTEKTLREKEREFWKAAWSSDMSRLPILAGDWGRLVMRMRMNIRFFAMKYRIEGHLDFPEVPHLEVTFRDLVVEICCALGVLFVIAGHILVLSVLLSHQSIYQSMSSLSEFQTSFYDFHSRVIRLQFTGITPYFEAMVNQFDVLYTDEFREMMDQIECQNFSLSFQEYAQFLAVNKSFNIDLFIRFVDSYSTILGNLGRVFENKSREKTSIYETYVVIMTIVFPTVVLVVIVASLVMRYVRIKRFIMNFPTIDKQLLERVGDFTNKQRLLDTFKVDRTFSAIRAFPLSFAYDLGLFVLCCLSVTSLLDAEASVARDTETFIFIIDAYENLQRVPVWLVSALFSAHFTQFDYFWACLADSYFLTSKLQSDTRLSDFVGNFPPEYYELCGRAVYNNLTSLDTEKTLGVIQVILNNSAALEQKQPFTTVFYWQRFFSDLVSFLLVTIVIVLVLARLKPVTLSEQRMSQLLLQRLTREYDDQGAFDELSDSSSNSIVSTSFDAESVPLFLFVVDDQMILKYQTSTARQILRCDTDQPISQSSLEMITQSQISSEIQRYKQNHSTAPVSIPFDDQYHSLLITPYYSYHLDLVLQYVVIVKLDEPPNETEEMEKRLQSSFYSVYPVFVPLDHGFPCVLPSKEKISMVILFKLVGFNDWATSTDIEVVMRFRRAIIDRFREAMGKRFVCLRQTANSFVFMANREDDEMTVWNIHEFCGTFGEKLLAEQKRTCRDYNATGVTGCLLLFRTKDQSLYISNSRMSLIDFQGDASVFELEHALDYCKPDVVNLTTLKPENKLKHVTKVRACQKSDGKSYDMFVVV